MGWQNDAAMQHQASLRPPPVAPTPAGPPPNYFDPQVNAPFPRQSLPGGDPRFQSQFPQGYVPNDRDDLSMFLGQNPSLFDLITRQQPWGLTAAKPSQAYGGTGVGLAYGLQQSGEIANPLAYGNLIQMLLGQGKTDPALMNRQIGQIGRDTQMGQTQLAGELARTGNTRSGVGQATSAAMGQAGRGQVADLRAQDTAMAADRQRQDLGLFMQMIQNPMLDLAGIGAGIAGQNRAHDQANKAADQAFWSNILGTAAIAGTGGAAAPAVAAYNQQQRV